MLASEVGQKVIEGQPDDARVLEIKRLEAYYSQLENEINFQLQSSHREGYPNSLHNTLNIYCSNENGINFLFKRFSFLTNLVASSPLKLLKLDPNSIDRIKTCLREFYAFDESLFFRRETLFLLGSYPDLLEKLPLQNRSELKAILHPCCTDPSNLTHRLALADFIDENMSPQTSDFRDLIMTQKQLLEVHKWDIRHTRLSLLEAKAYKSLDICHNPAMSLYLPDPNVEFMKISPENYLGGIAEIKISLPFKTYHLNREQLEYLKATPIRKLTLSHRAAESIEALADEQHEWLESVEVLNLEADIDDYNTLQRLLMSKNLRNVSELHINLPIITGEIVEILEQAAFSDKLTNLYFMSFRTSESIRSISDDFFAAFARSRLAANITGLGLTGSASIGPEVLECALSAANMRLRELRLSNFHLTNDHFKVLARSNSLERINSINFDQCGFDENVSETTIREAPWFHSIEILSCYYSGYNEVVSLYLLNAPKIKELNFRLLNHSPKTIRRFLLAESSPFVLTTNFNFLADLSNRQNEWYFRGLSLLRNVKVINIQDSLYVTELESIAKWKRARELVGFSFMPCDESTESASFQDLPPFVGELRASIIEVEITNKFERKLFLYGGRPHDRHFSHIHDKQVTLHPLNPRRFFVTPNSV